MNDQASVPGGDEDQLSQEPAAPEDSEESEEAREAALTEELLRLQERHREGGIEPGLRLGAESGDGAVPAD